MAETKQKTTKTSTAQKTQSGFTFTTEVIFIYLVSIIGFIFSFMDSSKYTDRCKFLYNQAGAIFIISFSLSLLSLIPYVGNVSAIVTVVLLVFTIIASVN